MSNTFQRIVKLVEEGEVKISNHGYDELANDGLTVREIIDGLPGGGVVEDYPEYRKGACVLIVQKDSQGNSIHVVWGIPKSYSSPAVLVTAYRPDPDKWLDDFSRRR